MVAFRLCVAFQEVQYGYGSLRLSSSLLQVAVLYISRPLSPTQSYRNRTFFPSGTFSSGPSNLNSHFCLKSLNLLYMSPGLSQSMAGGVYLHYQVFVDKSLCQGKLVDCTH